MSTQGREDGHSPLHSAQWSYTTKRGCSGVRLLRVFLVVMAGSGWRVPTMPLAI